MEVIWINYVLKYIKINFFLFNYWNMEVEYIEMDYTGHVVCVWFTKKNQFIRVICS